MATITKKIQPIFFEAILSGKKKYELRLNDFEIAEGDILVLEEWDGEPRKFTGRKIEKIVSYVGKFKVDELFWPESEVRDKGLQIISFT
ncbi:DUF3850 domain-containing protein [Candidatus Uhrbacteria bacterium]|nr:DUF3850 domain-containing protein [Candidatus Uhrbacteria bacterium]